MSAGRLVGALQDTTRAAKLDRLYREIYAVVTDLKQTKKVMKEDLEEELKGIGVWKANLDCREKEAIASTIRDNAECETSVGALLDQAVADMAADL